MRLPWRLSRPISNAGGGSRWDAQQAAAGGDPQAAGRAAGGNGTASAEPARGAGMDLRRRGGEQGARASIPHIANHCPLNPPPQPDLGADRRG